MCIQALLCLPYRVPNPGVATLRRPSPIKEDPVFCDVCSRRQTLLIHALAEYLPEKGHPQYKKRLSEYPEYKKYLETRYPMACEACSGRAEIELLKQERRYKLAALNFPKQKHASPPRPPSKSKLLKRTWSVTVSLFKYAKTAKLFVVMSAVALVGWFSLLSWARMFFHTQYEGRTESPQRAMFPLTKIYPVIVRVGLGTFYRQLGSL